MTISNAPARTLTGGPRDGATHRWPLGTDLYVAHPCRHGGASMDSSRYDPQGRYLYSECVVADPDDPLRHTTVRYDADAVGSNRAGG